jgi:hypothetical protein
MTNPSKKSRYYPLTRTMPIFLNMICRSDNIHRSTMLILILFEDCVYFGGPALALYTQQLTELVLYHLCSSIACKWVFEWLTTELTKGKTRLINLHAIDLWDWYYQCPTGETLKRSSYDQYTESIIYRTSAKTCRSYPMKRRCTRSSYARIVKRSIYQDYLDRVRQYHSTSEYLKVQRKRSVSRIGKHVKSNMSCPIQCQFLISPLS